MSFLRQMLSGKTYINGIPVNESAWTGTKYPLILNEDGTISLGSPDVYGGDFEIAGSQIRLRHGTYQEYVNNEPGMNAGEFLYITDLEQLVTTDGGFPSSTIKHFQLIELDANGETRKGFIINSLNDLNVVLNPGFEGALAIENWTLSNSNNNNTSERVTDTYHSGSYSMHLNLSAPFPDPLEYGATEIQQSNALTDTSTITFYVKRGTSTEGTLKVIINNGTEQTLATYALSTLSTSFEQKSVTGYSGTITQLIFRLEGESGDTSEVWIDDVSALNGSSENVINNPGFESGVTDWFIAETYNNVLSEISSTVANTGTKSAHLNLDLDYGGSTSIHTVNNDLINTSRMSFYVKRGTSTSGTVTITAVKTGIVTILDSWDVSSLSTSWEETTINTSDWEDNQILYITLRCPYGEETEIWLDDFSALDETALPYSFVDLENYYDGTYPRFRGVTSTTPSDPIAGDIWIDTTSGSVPKIYDGSSWIALT